MAFDDLVALMELLRSPEGCPWDREQTHRSILPNLIEEAYEVSDAIEAGDFDLLREELGDLLLQVVFHSQMADEAGRFSVEDVVDGIQVKLKRRHPHVFGQAEVDSSDQVIRNWNEIKGRERAGESHLSGVPQQMPALALAQKLQAKAARTGFDWPDSQGVLEKLSEEVEELAGEDLGSDQAAEEFGDLLFTLVNLAQRLGIDAEGALRGGARKFRRRFERMEALARERDLDFQSLSLAEKDELWNQAKLD